MFASSYGFNVEVKEEISSGVLGASATLTEWLDTSRAPKGLRKAEGELGASAGVYRNAAVAFDSLAQADPDQHAARYEACERLLDQGDHHVEVFDSIIQKKGLAG